MNVTLYGKNDFADMIKLRILRWRYYPGLIKWALNVITSVIRERQKEICIQRGQVMMNTEIGVIFFEDEGRGHHLKNAGGYQKLKKVK